MNEKEAEDQPAGLGIYKFQIKLLNLFNTKISKGRSAPAPLPEPNRPETSFLWFTQPWQTFRLILWRNHWKKIIIFIIVIVLVITLVIFLVQLPSFIFQKILG